SSASDEHDDGEVEFEVQGDDDDARSVLRGPDFQPSCAQAVRPPAHARRASAIRRHGEDREEKHVSFVEIEREGRLRDRQRSSDQLDFSFWRYRVRPAFVEFKGDRQLFLAVDNVVFASARGLG
ncbi:hypothetical protein PHISCL_10518, partial [Aspergillus sclerotialis]